MGEDSTNEGVRSKRGQGKSYAMIFTWSIVVGSTLSPAKEKNKRERNFSLGPRVPLRALCLVSGNYASPDIKSGSLCLGLSYSEYRISQGTCHSLGNEAEKRTQKL